jgi:hypothetical protein
MIEPNALIESFLMGAPLGDIPTTSPIVRKTSAGNLLASLFPPIDEFKNSLFQCRDTTNDGAIILIRTDL